MEIAPRGKWYAICYTYNKSYIHTKNNKNMKTLKTILPIGILLFFCLSAVAEKKQKTDTAALGKIERLMKSRIFYVEVDEAYPSGNSSVTINSKYGQKRIGGEGYVSLATNQGQIFFLDTIATGRLPFFGRAYSVPYGEGGGVEFEKAKIYDESFKVIKKRKKNYIEYKFNVRNRNDVFNFYIEVYANGKCSVNVTSNNRASISYGGKLTPIPEDKKKAMGL